MNFLVDLTAEFGLSNWKGLSHGIFVFLRFRMDGEEDGVRGSKGVKKVKTFEIIKKHKQTNRETTQGYPFAVFHVLNVPKANCFSGFGVTLGHLHCWGSAIN